MRATPSPNHYFCISIKMGQAHLVKVRVRPNFTLMIGSIRPGPGSSSSNIYLVEMDERMLMGFTKLAQTDMEKAKSSLRLVPNRVA